MNQHQELTEKLISLANKGEPLFALRIAIQAILQSGHYRTFCWIASYAAFKNKNERIAVRLGVLAAALVPTDAEIYSVLGAQTQVSADNETASPFFRRAIKLAPTQTRHRMNAAISDMNRNFIEEAAGMVDSVLKEEPTNIVAYQTLVVLAKKRPGYSSRAIAFRLLALDPCNETALTDLAMSSTTGGQVMEAKKWSERALMVGINPEYFRSWVAFIANYRVNADDSVHFLANRQVSRQDESDLRTLKNAHRRTLGGRRLKIGYLSSEFQNFVLHVSMLDVLKAHDRNRFAVHSVICDIADRSGGKTEGERLKAIKEACDKSTEIRNTSEDRILQVIETSEIDIMVCLDGWLHQHRRVFRHRMAPVQVNYVNYVSTSGIANMDYRISDPWLDPTPDHDRWSTEKIVRLENGHQFWCLPDHDLHPGPPPCLKNGYVTFGSFNNTSKIQPETLKLWRQILEAVPDSRLLIKSHFKFSDLIHTLLQRQLQDVGLDLSRLDLVYAALTAEDNDAIKFQTDIALDPFPFTGGQTSIDTLNAGIPFITLSGNSYIHRVGESILARCGLPELVARTLDQYLSIAASLAQAPERIAQYRSSLPTKLRQEHRMALSTHMDDLESAYERMWFEKTGEMIGG